jgi:hypothetical protein
MASKKDTLVIISLKIVRMQILHHEKNINKEH